MKTRLYRTWIDMKRRCYGPNCNNFHNYGGRGIMICETWRTSFPTFQKWALENGYTDEMTIDRIDSNYHYEPENCQWITMDANRRKRKHGGVQVAS